MTDVRREISNLLGHTIPEDGWDATFAELEKSGRINQKQMVKMMIVVLKRLEEYELRFKSQ